jgi:hypothetical protein
MLRALVTTAVLAVALAGCGSAATDGREPAEAAYKPLRLTKAQARSTAGAMLLRASDLPDWTPAAIPDADVPACRSLDGGPRSPGEAGSAFTNLDEGAYAASGAILFRNERTARRAFAALVRTARGSQLRRCLSAALNTGAATAGGSGRLARFRPVRFRVGRSWGIRMTGSVQNGSASVGVHLTLFAMQHRQAVAYLMTGRVRTPFSSRFDLGLARRIHERMKRAQEAYD